MYETCKKHMMWFCPKNCSFHWVLINVSLGWGKCTGDNSYDQLAQDFLADFLIWVWGCFSKPLWKQWLGRVAIPSSVGLVLSSCHPFLGAQVAQEQSLSNSFLNLYPRKKHVHPKRQPRRCLKEKHVLTLHRITFSVRCIPNDSPKGVAGCPFLAALLNLGQTPPTVKELGP